ncbi:MAG: TPR end-of-group domain-containing protein [Phycisphaerales bacterium JB041]
MWTQRTRAAGAAALLILTTCLPAAAPAQDAREATAASQPAPAPTAQDARQLQAARQWDAAAAAWESLARLDPQDGEAVFNLGYCLHMAGHIERALDVHRKATEFEAYRGLAFYNAGCAHALLGEHDAAISALTASANAGYRMNNALADPDLNSLHNDLRFHALLNRPAPGILGRVQRLMHDAEAVYDHYAPGIRRNLASAATVAEAQAQDLAQSLMQHERLGPIARRIAGLVRSRSPQESATAETAPRPGAAPSLATARKLQQAEDWPNAAAAYTDVLQRDPQNADAAFGRAYCLHMHGDFTEAIPAHRHAASFPQFTGIALYNLGCAFARTGRPDEAFEALKKSHEAGFDLKRYLSTDTDLDSLRKDDRFDVLLVRVHGGL